MPTIFEPNDLPERKEGDASFTTLANAAMIGVDALQVERVIVEPGQKSEPASAGEGECFLYVIRGAGWAQIEEESFALTPESMLWIESGETFTLEASEEQLEVLVCRAPAQ